jgi:very-short-patch-repair endonuclease
MTITSDLESAFANLWVAYYPEIDLYTEHRFAPPRKFKFDFAHIPSKIAIELQGSIWQQGRHSRGSGLLNEYTKMNLAASLGWRVFYLCTNTVNDEAIYKQIATAIQQSQSQKT